MKPWTCALVLVLISCAAAGALAGDDPLLDRAQEIKALFRADPGGFEKIFDKAFLEAVPPARLAALIKGLAAAHGACVSSELVERKGRFSGVFELTFEKKVSMRSSLSVSPAKPHLVLGWFLHNPEPAASSFGELLEMMKKLDGKVSFAAVKIAPGERETVAALSPDAPLAIGSAFKLYVLGAVAAAVERGALAWDTAVPVMTEWKSLPSGQMQDWPAGSKHTIHTYACLMISVSDNTATDHLLHTVGRAAAEEACAAMGNAHAKSNAPFLSTLDLFRLKCDSSGLRAAAYLGMNPEQRRAWLDGGSRLLSRESLEADVLVKPIHVDTLEWFASAADLARAMEWLLEASKRPGLSELKGILSINKGIALYGFDYAGFKGGSEPGVINGTFLLKSKKGVWFALAGTWNDAKKAVDQAKFFGLLQKAAGLLSGLEPEGRPDQGK